MRFRGAADQVGVDIWHVAHLMMQMFGVNAAIRAPMRADRLMTEADVEGFEIWERVTVALLELNRLTPREGEMIH